MTQPTPYPSSASRPRLLYFQFRYDARLPRFLLIHKDEHVRCLQQKFDVVVINADCDYDAACAAHEPDLALFESGVPNPLCRRLQISNTHTHPHIPKIGLLHADAFCQGREGFISDMYEWGIETFFTIATAALDFNRDMEGRLFFWPNSVDPAIYRDYGEKKSIEVLFTGNTSALYPWRQKLLTIVPKRYSSTIKAHPGYSPSAQASRVAVGEAYARMINSAFFVPSCGTVAKEIVRKHFEIPACNSCLITERTPAIEAAGYEDMVNCVFADEHTVLEKLDSLFGNMDRLQEITRAGHALVHSRHTMKQRDQIHQWFELNRMRSVHQRIVQADPFAPMQLVARDAVRFPEEAIVRPQLDLLAQGDDRFQHKDFGAARQFYQRCSHFVDYMPEPHLRIAQCELQLGHAAEAHSWITRPLEFSLGMYGARDPDPVEWATYVLCLLCLGRRREAVRSAGMYPDVDHLELRRVRWLALFLAQGAHPLESIPAEVLPPDRLTIHRLPSLTTRQWIDQTVNALRANGRNEWARALSGAGARVQPKPGRTERPRERSMQSGIARVQASRRVGAGSHLREDQAATRRYFARRAWERQAKRTAVVTIRRWLYRLESRLGYFLPFQYSSIRQQEFFLRLQEAFNDTAVSSAIAIAPGREDKYAQGFLQTAAASTKAAVLRSWASCDIEPNIERSFDLALVDCSTPAEQEELARVITTFAGTSRYLFFVNCQQINQDRLGALLGGQFERTATTSEGGSHGEHLAFRRIQSDVRQRFPRLSVAKPS
jgi:hypothetical protein